MSTVPGKVDKYGGHGRERVGESVFVDYTNC